MKNTAIHLNAKTLKSVLFVKITVVIIDQMYQRDSLRNLTTSNYKLNIYLISLTQASKIKGTIR